MWLERTVMFPTLHATIRSVLESPECTVQFVLEPLAFPDILADYLSLGIHFANLLSYLTRTFAFYMHSKYQSIVNNPINLPHPQVVLKQLSNTRSFSVPGDASVYHPQALSTYGDQDDLAAQGGSCRVQSELLNQYQYDNISMGASDSFGPRYAPPCPASAFIQPNNFTIDITNANPVPLLAFATDSVCSNTNTALNSYTDYPVPVPGLYRGFPW